MPTATTLTGDKELDRALKDFLPKYQKKALRPGLRAAAKIVAKDLEALTPEETGLLVLSIRVKAAARSRTRFGTNILIGSDDISEYSPFYALFVEFGHVARDGSMVEPKPFARPALWDNAVEIYRLFIQISKDKINQIAAELRKK